MESITMNNSVEMKTAVETFVIEETAELIYDNEKLSQWNNLVTELGLEGQTKIVKPDKSPIPFMPMNDVLKLTFETLCPRKVAIGIYDVSPIPVEILSLASLSKKEGYFEKIQIWYDEKTKDPVCVGITAEYYVSNGSENPSEMRGKTYPSKAIAIENGFDTKNGCGWDTNEKYYLIGKWADVKHPFPELIEMAKKRYISEHSAELNKKITDYQRDLSDLVPNAERMFASGVNLLPF